MRGLAVLICLASCATGEWPDVERGESELRERDIVWESFGATDEAPPTVDWETGEKCPDLARDFGGLYILLDGKCLLGRYHEPDHRARVIWTEKISASAYAHEMYHGWLWIHTGDLDRDHWDPGWSTVVWNANSLLRQVGL